MIARGEALLRAFPATKEHEVMRAHTTMGVGGVADYYLEVRQLDQLVHAVLLAQKLGLAYLVLGGSSNIVFSDFGFAGLVIKNATHNLAFLSEKAQVVVDSGVLLARMIIEMANRDLSGLEPLFGIPGTVGGAIYNNTESHGVAACDYLKSLTVLTAQGKIVRYPARALVAKRHTTKFKQMNASKPVILSLRLQFFHNKKEEIMRKLQYYRRWRVEHQPIAQKSAGMFFCDPAPAAPTKAALHETQTARHYLEQIEGEKMRVGDMRVFGANPNFLVNRGHAKASEARALATALKAKVQAQHGVMLEETVEYLGQW